MAITLLTGQHGVSQSSTTDSGNVTLDTTGADFLLLAYTHLTARAATIVDAVGGQSNTWNLVTAKTNSGVTTALYSSIPTHVGASHTFKVTVAGGDGYPSVGVAAFVGVDPSYANAALDKTNGHNTTSSPCTTGATGTLSEANELIVYGCGDDWAGTFGDGGFGTVTDSAAIIGGTSFAASLGYKVQSATTTANPSLTASGTVNRMNACIATFRSNGSTIALVTNAHTLKQGSSQAGSGTSSAIDTTGAKLIVITRCTTAASPAAPTDSASNSWVLAKQNDNGTTKYEIWYCLAPITNASHTFASTTNGFDSIAVAAFTNVLNPADAISSAATASGTSLASGSITPSINNALIFFVSGDTWTSGGSFSTGTTLDHADLVSNTSYAKAIGYVVQTSAAAVNPSYSWSGGAAAAETLVAAFKSTVTAVVSGAAHYYGAFSG